MSKCPPLATSIAPEPSNAPVSLPLLATITKLIRCATLAASSHNTQPWTFQIASDAITIRPDLTRRCKVVDPNDAHLFKSLGCATENLVQAAAAQGLGADVQFDARHDAVIVSLSRSAQASSTELFDAINTRQCTRFAFDGTPVHSGDVAKLELAGSGARVTALLPRTACADPSTT